MDLQNSMGWQVILQKLSADRQKYYAVVINSPKANERLSAADKLKMIDTLITMPRDILKTLDGSTSEDTLW